jgi:hypothetical protein
VHRQSRVLHRTENGRTASSESETAESPIENEN